MLVRNSHPLLTYNLPLLAILLLSTTITPGIVTTYGQGQQATITVPQNSIINNATVSVFQPRFLSGTWNFVNGQGNVSGVITFSNQDLCPSCKSDWQHTATFSGIFSGHPVSGKYTWENAPGGHPSSSKLRASMKTEGTTNTPLLINPTAR